MTPSNVTRLSVQHAQKPHCESCHRDLPSVGNLTLSRPTGDLSWQNVTLVALTFHVRCACSAEWDMTVDVNFLENTRDARAAQAAR